MFRKLSKSKKTIAIIFALSLLCVSYKSPPEQVVLKAGTPVVLEISQPIISNSIKLGDVVNLRVKYDINVKDKTVIPFGAIATAQVTKVMKARGCGKKGYLEIQVNGVTAIDGQKVLLTSNLISREGHSRAGAAFGLGFGLMYFIGPFSLFFLFIKGTDAEIPAGTTVDAAVQTNTTITVD